MGTYIVYNIYDIDIASYSEIDIDYRKKPRKHRKNINSLGKLKSTRQLALTITQGKI